MDSIKHHIATLGKNAKKAAKSLRCATTAAKNNALTHIAQRLDKDRALILQANHKDMLSAKHNAMGDALLDRLMLDDGRLDGMIESIKQIIALPDPVGKITNLNYRPSGIQVGKMRTPLGVIAMIYESRPNVTIDAAALCLKSGNSVILRGGSEAIYSNLAL